MITSGGKRNPAKLDLGAGTRRERRRIDQAFLILLSTDATVPMAARLSRYAEGRAAPRRGGRGLSCLHRPCQPPGCASDAQATAPRRRAGASHDINLGPAAFRVPLRPFSRAYTGTRARTAACADVRRRNTGRTARHPAVAAVTVDRGPRRSSRAINKRGAGRLILSSRGRGEPGRCTGRRSVVGHRRVRGWAGAVPHRPRHTPSSHTCELSRRRRRTTGAAG